MSNPRVSIVLDEDAMAALRKQAKKKKTSISKLIAAAIREQLGVDTGVRRNTQGRRRQK